MNRYSIVTAIAIAVIVIPFTYSGLNIFGGQQLEYRWDNPGEFSFFAMSNHGEMEFCNPMPFWTSFQKFQIATFYDEEHIGSFVVNPVTINPSSSVVLEGLFSAEKITMAQTYVYDIRF